MPDLSNTGYDQPPGSGQNPPTAPQTAAVSRPAHPAAIGWGIALVVIGGLFLAEQFVPGLSIWRLWPLIIVAFGIRGLFPARDGVWGVKRAADGLTTITIGLVLLGQVLGVLAWDVWLSILRLWPLLLVALGIEVLGVGLRSQSVRALSNVVVIAGLLIGALVLAPAAPWPWSVWGSPALTPFAESAPHDAAIESGSARVEGGVGSLSLAAGDALASAEGNSPFEPRFEVSKGGQTADVRIGMGAGTWTPGGEPALSVTLDRRVTWDLDVSTGVSSFDVDLRDLALERLTFDAGVSGGILRLGGAAAGGARGAVPVSVDTGVSSVRLRLPEGEHVRIRVSSGLLGVDMPSDWALDRSGDRRTYESPGFSGDGSYWDVEVRAGIGSLNVAYE